MDPEALISKAEKVLGPVARRIGEEVLERVGSEVFLEEYKKELSRITGNPALIDNLFEGV